MRKLAEAVAWALSEAQAEGLAVAEVAELGVAVAEEVAEALGVPEVEAEESVGSASTLGLAECVQAEVPRSIATRAGSTSKRVTGVDRLTPLRVECPLFASARASSR
jgi:hypothetical protein